MDTDQDGMVTSRELGIFVAALEASDTKWNRTSITYEGDPVESTDVDITYHGAVGLSNRTSRLVQQITVDLDFDEKIGDKEHTYEWNDELTRDPEFHFWKAPNGSSFTIEASSYHDADNYVILTGNLPEPLMKYLNGRRTNITMENAELRADWNATMVASQTISFKDESPSDEGDETCCSSLIIPMAIFPAVMMVSTTRRRGALPG
jgi:hypothetical protein